MKKYLLLLTALVAATAVHAQGDDVYFVPKKEVKTAAAKKTVAAETYYIGSDRDVDEYNRHGALYSTVDSLGNDIVDDFDAAPGEYPDSLSEDYAFDDGPVFDAADENDFQYSRELNRWYGGDCACCDDFGWPYYSRWGWPYYSWWGGWYSPWYYGWGWCDPWYYGWYSPWYYGWGWYGGIGHVRNYSNRRVHGALAGMHGVGGRRGTRNVYNDIANRHNTSRRYAGTRGATTTRSTGVRSTARSSYNSQRSYTPQRSTSTTRSSGSFGGSHGSFGGGGLGGGMRGGGGGHGGRR